MHQAVARVASSSEVSGERERPAQGKSLYNPGDVDVFSGLILGAELSIPLELVYLF